MLVDTHTHLYADAFNKDRDKLIEAALAAGVKKFYMPNIDRESIDPMLELARRYPEHCYPMMGLHPCSVDQHYHAALTEITTLLSQGGFKAVGEIGIDLYWDKTHRKAQEIVFAEQLELAVSLNLPVVIHTRESFDVVYDLIRNMPEKPRGVFHCFTGTIEQAHQALSLGDFFLGIGGVVTFKNSGLDKVVRAIDMKHLVLETDAPYLAPVPHRGKRNEPAYLADIARKVAELKNLSFEEVSEITTTNAARLFGA